jgi:hypothetical protein
MDAEQYDEMMAEIKLMRKIAQAEQRVEGGEAYMSMEELRKKLNV